MAYMKLSEKPVVFMDGETSGLRHGYHELLEFAGIKGSETLVLKIKPRRIGNADPKALEVNGYNEAEWADALYYKTAAGLILAFLKDCVIVGHNVKFDADFITALLREAGYHDRIDYHLIDTCTLAFVVLVPMGLESLSLKNVCPFMGIPPEPTMHRALAGAMACKNVYLGLSDYIRENSGIKRDFQ